jgi:hypothetical protein
VDHKSVSAKASLTDFFLQKHCSFEASSITRSSRPPVRPRNNLYNPNLDQEACRSKTALSYNPNQLNSRKQR